MRIAEVQVTVLKINDRFNLCYSAMRVKVLPARWQFRNFEVMDVLTPEQRRRNMQAIKSTETKMEVRLAKALWARGHRYRKNNKTIFGKPDLTFKKYKIAVFVDSEYFHGKDWETEKHRIKTNTDFWWKKREGNMARDIEVTNKLT